MECFDVQQNPNKIQLKIDSCREDDDDPITVDNYHLKGLFTLKLKIVFAFDPIIWIVRCDSTAKLWIGKKDWAELTL